MSEIVDCEEFGEIEIDVERLLKDRKFSLDPRIAERGYFSVSIAKGRLVLRADRFVGLIPISEGIAVRVKSRANIYNISRILILSGVAPVAIEGFSRGYLPRFVSREDVEPFYCEALLSGVEKILDAGLMKKYTAIRNPPPWRGRLMVSQTVKQHRAQGVTYKNEFSFETLSYDGAENQAIKLALRIVLLWLTSNQQMSSETLRAKKAIGNLTMVSDYAGSTESLVQQIARVITKTPSVYSYYVEPLWIAYLILQNKMPDIGNDGFVTMDSLLVDMSKVFEAFIRNSIRAKAESRGWTIIDGNKEPVPLFTDNGIYPVKPDIMIYANGKPIAVIDAKYKPAPKETDRYEILSFMEALGVSQGAFVCPQTSGNALTIVGTTCGGKCVSVIRFDLSSWNLDDEVEQLVQNVERVILMGIDRRQA